MSWETPLGPGHTGVVGHLRRVPSMLEHPEHCGGRPCPQGRTKNDNICVPKAPVTGDTWPPFRLVVRDLLVCGPGICIFPRGLYVLYTEV